MVTAARMDVVLVAEMMETTEPRDGQITDLATLIRDLDQDRAWLLEQIDRGRWPDLRLDLAALEREMGQLLARAAERVERDAPSG